MNSNDINDKRILKEFKGITFSKFKKNDAKKQLLNNLKLGEIESSLYWSCEFICAGHIDELWEIIFLSMSQQINLGNPKLPLYINLRLGYYNELIIGYEDNRLKLRNNSKLRKLFSEIICILCLSKKKWSYDSPKIKESDYMITNLNYKLKAKNMDLGKRIYTKEDPKELFIAINEFYWSISNSIKNTIDAFYWIEWLLGFESLYKKNKKHRTILKGLRRKMPVENNFQKDYIWIIWEILLYEGGQKSNGLHKVIESIRNIFCYKFSNGTTKKRKYLIYYAITLITEPYDIKIKIYNDSKKITTIVDNINTIYKQVKKNEITPATDYLFNNSITKGNLEKTMEKLDKFNSIVNMIPRN